MILELKINPLIGKINLVEGVGNIVTRTIHELGGFLRNPQPTRHILGGLFFISQPTRYSNGFVGSSCRMEIVGFGWT